MRIHAVTQPYSAEMRKVENAKKVDKESKISKSVTDKSEISSGAKQLSETKAQFETISASLATQPEIRAERIIEVKRKIESGYYNSEEFLEKLTDKLLNEFGISDNKI
jgi:negative regulator of flagellin synthesis FlgM